VGDLGGLAAGLYRRGIRYVQVPTTLLAQVDSSIGGKTAVDLPHGKNLVGMFYQPGVVLIDPAFLRTLPDRQFRSGLAEVIKSGVIADARLFSLLEGTTLQKLRRDEPLLQEIISRTVRVKASLVSKDELETKGLRTLLNFGHTFGHAVEAAVGFRRIFTHGEAVAGGMQVASDISRRLGRMPEQEHRRLMTLIRRMGLPVRAPGLPPAKLRRAMSHDKKWGKGKNRWVLPDRIGRCTVRDAVPERTVRQAIESFLEG
jgi:3-dehydroquinate synthase